MTDEWRESAACLHVGPHLFFPDDSDHNTAGRNADQIAAIGICRECPVRMDCLEEALTRPEPYGVWGGLSANQRRRMRKQI